MSTNWYYTYAFMYDALLFEANVLCVQIPIFLPFPAYVSSIEINRNIWKAREKYFL